MPERWIVTPTGGTPVVIPHTPQLGVARITDVRTPPPPARVQWANRPEGALPTVREHENREITLKIQLTRTTDPWRAETHDFGSAPAEAEGDGELLGWSGTVRRCGNGGRALEPAIRDLAQLLGALRETGGTLTRVLDSNERVTFDVLSAADTDGPAWDLAYYAAQATTVTLALTCAPFGRGTERPLGTGTATSGQRFVVLDQLQVPGDVPALARLEYSAATVAQTSLLYAIDQPDAASRLTGLQIGAVDLVTVPGSAQVKPNGSVRTYGRRIPGLPTGAPADRWDPIAFLRTATGPLSLTGQYRVLVRITNGGQSATTVRLRWSGGAREGGTSANAPTTVQGADWLLADLGVVTVSDVFDGVIERQAPPGVALDVDVILLVPTDLSAQAVASTQVATDTLLAADPATGTGALTGSAASLGGTWLGAGPGPDFTRSSLGASRPAGAWRRVGLAVPSADVETSARLALNDTPDANGRTGIVGVYLANASGHLAFSYDRAVLGDPAPADAWGVGVEIDRLEGNARMRLVYAVPSGRVSGLRTLIFPQGSTWGSGYRRLQLRFDPVGRVYGELEDPYGTREVSADTFAYVATPPSSLIAAIAGNPTVGPLTFLDFTATGTGAADRLLHPGKTATIATSSATRTTPEGYAGPFVPIGDRPVLPPSGRAARPVRVAMGVFRSDLRTGTDPAADDVFTATVHATPRYLQIPSTPAGEVIDGGTPAQPTPTYPLDGGTP